MNDLLPFKQDTKLKKQIKTVTIEVPELVDNRAKLVEKQIYQEKILELVFFNGEENEKIQVRNLAEVIDGKTREQRLLARIMEGDGHIMLAESGRIIRVKNIISATPKWVNLKAEVEH